eukprot:153894_1
MSDEKATTVTASATDAIPHYIQATTVTNDTIVIKLTTETVDKDTSFYIRQCDKANEEFEGFVHRIKVKEDKNTAELDIDIEEDFKEDIEDIKKKPIIFALYKKNDKQKISNTLHITVPDKMDTKNYKPNPISSSSVKAFMTDNIYVYFDLPSNVYGKDIKFKINYVDNKDKKSKLSYLPIIIPITTIPIPFTITTVSVIKKKEHYSIPSGVIKISTPQIAKQSVSLRCLNPKYQKINILIEDMNTKYKSFESFQKMIIETCEKSVNKQSLSALVIQTRVNGKYKNIANEQDYNKLNNNKLNNNKYLSSTMAIELVAYFMPQKPYHRFTIKDIIIVMDHWSPDDVNTRYNKYLSSEQSHPLCELINKTVNVNSSDCTKYTQTSLIKSLPLATLNLNKEISKIIRLTEKEIEQIFAKYKTFEKDECIKNMENILMRNIEQLSDNVISGIRRLIPLKDDDEEEEEKKKIDIDVEVLLYEIKNSKIIQSLSDID